MQKLDRVIPALHLSKPNTKYSWGTVKLERDFSSAIALVLLTFKLINYIHRLFDAPKDMRPMARLSGLSKDRNQEQVPAGISFFLEP